MMEYSKSKVEEAIKQRGHPDSLDVVVEFKQLEPDTLELRDKQGSLILRVAHSCIERIKAVLESDKPDTVYNCFAVTRFIAGFAEQPDDLSNMKPVGEIRDINEVTHNQNRVCGFQIEADMIMDVGEFRGYEFETVHDVWHSGIVLGCDASNGKTIILEKARWAPVQFSYLEDSIAFYLHQASKSNFIVRVCELEEFRDS